MRFQGKLTCLFPSRFVSSFLETLDSFCIPSMYSYPIESPHFIPLLNPRSFLQWYTTVLDVCAGVVRVGKMLSMLWCSSVCVNGARSIRPGVIQMGDSINHTINPTGTGVALAPGLPAHSNLLQMPAGMFPMMSPWARSGTAASSNVFFSSASSGNQTCVFPKRGQHPIPSWLQALPKSFNKETWL